MKLTMKIMAFVAAVTFATSCVTDTPAYGPETGKPGTTEVGYLDLSSVQAQVLLEAETSTEKAQKGTRAYEAADGSYIVRIYNSTGTPVLDTTVDQLATEFGDDNLLELATGNYTLEVLSKTEAPAVSTVEGFYATDPRISFSVTRDNNAANPVKIGDGQVVCKLQSVKVSVELSADLKDELGNKYTATVTMRGVEGASASFDQDTNGEENPAYLKPADTNGANTLDFVLVGTKTLDGVATENATLKRTIENVKKGQWRKINVSVVHATTGEIYIDVKVETLVLDSEITVNGVAGWSEPVLDEAEEPELRWEGYNLTLDSFALDNMQYDDYHEFNGTAPKLSIVSASGLKSVLLTVASGSTTVSEAVSDLELVNNASLPSAYTRLKINEGAKEVALDLSRLFNIFYDKEDTHTLTFKMTDMKDKVGTGVFTIVYGEPEDPLITSSVTLGTPTAVVPDEPVSINVVSSEVITEFNVDIVSPELDGYLLAPGAESLAFLAEPFDLCKITNTDQKEALAGLGFPSNNGPIGTLGEDGKYHVDLVIGADFMGLLGTIQGTHTFNLKVKRESGTEYIERSLILVVE